MVGEFLLLRLARTDNADKADATYSTTIAMSEGTLQLWRNDKIVDQVCWAKSDACLKPFDGDHPTTLVRDFADGKFKHQESYDTHYNLAQPSLVLPTPSDPETEPQPSTKPQPDGETKPSTSTSGTSTKPTEVDPPMEDDEAAGQAESKCQGIEFTELLSYYATDKSEQFVELYNATDEIIDLSYCRVRYKKKTYPLAGKIAPEGYSVFRPISASPAFTFTKNPSQSNEIELLDANDEVVDVLIYEHGQKKSVSLAKFIDETNTEMWEKTYAPTPGASNIYQEFRTCPEGKVINEATGNCIKVTSTAIVKQKTLKQDSVEVAPCPEGKYRNPLTGRCKKIESTTSSEPKPCAEGYERNPETNRCRKIKSANDGETYALVPTTYSDKKTFVGLGAVLLLVCAGSVYIILQFRHEIARAARKARQRFHHIRKNLVAWCARFHRHK